MRRCTNSTDRASIPGLFGMGLLIALLAGCADTEPRPSLSAHPFDASDAISANWDTGGSGPGDTEGPSDTAEEGDDLTGSDVGEQADGTGTDDADAPVGNEDAPQPDVPAPLGETGDPCTANENCESGYCVPSGEGMVCTQLCVDTCPDGWACLLLTAAGSDPVYVCLDRSTNLCRPCAENGDCNEWGGMPGDKCLAQGGPLDGSFCAISCSDGGWCPEGYACVDQPGDGPAAAADGKLCLPSSGECTCNTMATLDEAQTPCGEGDCKGTR